MTSVSEILDPATEFELSPRDRRRHRRWPRKGGDRNNKAITHALRTVQHDARAIGPKCWQGEQPLMTIIPTRDFSESGWLLRCQIQDALERLGLAALAKIQGRTTKVVGFDREIGLTRVVETGADDECFWAPVRNSQGKFHTTPEGKHQFRRFVVGREGVGTNLLTLVFVREGDLLQVVTAYYGQPCALHPADPAATVEDRRWWLHRKTGMGHAFVLDPVTVKRVDLERKRDRCPH